MPGIISYGKDMWFFVSNLLSSVSLDVLCIVDGQLSVRVDGHQDGSSVGLLEGDEQLKALGE